MKPTLSLALSHRLPTEEQGLLLRACLHQGNAGRKAWADFQRRGPDLVHLLRHGPSDVRRLAPLLFVALRESRSAVNGSLLTVLRTAYLREEMRSREYLRVCASVVSTLDASGIPFIVFRGAALSETVYACAALRHSHDLNLLVPPPELRAASEVLQRAGCHARQENTVADALILDHQSGLPILLHSRFFRVSFYRHPWDMVWGRTGQRSVAGRTVHLLSPTDSLLHACCQALHSVRPQPFGWAADAYLIMQRNPDLNWMELLQSARQSRTELPVGVALDYLARALGAPVPAAVQAQLATATDRIDAVERDVALLTASRSGGMRVRRFLGGSASLVDKLRVLRWLVLPSRGYLEWASGAPLSASLPQIYLQRLGRYLARRASSRLRRMPAARLRLAAHGTRRGEHHLPAEPA